MVLKLLKNVDGFKTPKISIPSDMRPDAVKEKLVSFMEKHNKETGKNNFRIFIPNNHPQRQEILGHLVSLGYFHSEQGSNGVTEARRGSDLQRFSTTNASAFVLAIDAQQRAVVSLGEKSAKGERSISPFGGQVDRGESPRMNVEREFQEEAGGHIVNLRLVAMYNNPGDVTDDQMSLFVADVPDNQELRPQAGEIEKIGRVSVTDLETQKIDNKMLQIIMAVRKAEKDEQRAVSKMKALFGLRKPVDYMHVHHIQRKDKIISVIARSDANFDHMREKPIPATVQ